LEFSKARLELYSLKLWDLLFAAGLFVTVTTKHVLSDYLVSVLGTWGTSIYFYTI